MDVIGNNIAMLTPRDTNHPGNASRHAEPDIAVGHCPTVARVVKPQQIGLGVQVGSVDENTPRQHPAYRLYHGFGH